MEQSASVTCAECKQQIGEVVPQAEGIKLLKPFLAIRHDAVSKPQSFDMRKWLAGHLLSAVETTGVRKFYATSLPFELWVFTPDMTYCSSEDGGEPVKASKILFRATDPSKMGERDTLGSQQLHVEELGLPSVLERELSRLLEQSNESIPEAARMFQDWKVALLPRFVGV